MDRSSSLEEAIKIELNDAHIDIMEINYSRGSKEGDNYASQIQRIQIWVNTRHGQTFLSFIMKKMLPDGEASFVSEFGMFDKEKEMYVKVLPEINRLLHAADSNHVPLNARCIYTSGKPTDTLYLEDLGQIGFRIIDREIPLNMAQTLLVIEAFAKYHVASLKLKENYPEIFESFCEPSIWAAQSFDVSHPVVTGTFDCLIDVVSSWDEVDDDIKASLVVLKRQALDRLFFAHRYNRKSINVILHGDAWKNNFMFKCNEQGIYDEIRMVDFQLPSVNSPILDLLYFLFSSPDIEIQTTEMENLIKVYHAHFMSNIDILKVNLGRTLTAEEFLNEFNERIFFGFISFIVVFPITQVDPEGIIKMDDIMNGGKNTKRNLYLSKGFKNAFIRHLPLLRNKIMVM